MPTDKYNLHTIDYSVQGWDAILSADMEMLDDVIHTYWVVTLGEAATVHKAGYIGSDGKIWLAQANGVKMPAIGLFVEEGIADDEVHIQCVGPVTDATWTWTPGQPVYLSAVTPGALTQTPPDSNQEIIGIAKTATTIFLGHSIIDHVQGTDSALGAVGTKNPPIDADKPIYRDSTASDALVTSTWTQIKAFLKTYFDTLYNLYVHPNHSGDVTSVADGATTIAAEAVTYAKMQHISATDKVLGRETAGAGDVEEIVCTAAGRAILDDATAADQATTLGLGTGDSPTHVNIKLSGLSDGKIPYHIDDATGLADGPIKSDVDSAVSLKHASGSDNQDLSGLMVKASNLSDVANAVTAFENIKQAATESATGVVELNTIAETVAGTDTSRATTAQGVVTAVQALTDFYLDKTARIIEAHDSDHTRVVVNKGAYTLPLRIGTAYFFITASVDVDLDADLDTGVSAAGTDYFVYACNDSGSLIFKLSLASTYPAGFSASTSRKIGGFHTLCTNAGTISGHPLTDYVSKDILPASIWDLKHRAKCGNNAGMVYDAKSGIWVDIYLASGTGAGTASVNGGTISDTRTWLDFVDDGGAVSKRLLTDMEFQLAAAGSNEETNIFGSADPVTTGGHSDTASRRMISNIGCEDMCGAMYQWLQDQGYRWDSDGSMAAASKTLTIYHAASPGGNPIYIKYGTSGRPYLACNMATATTDKWLTFGSAVTMLIKHDAAAATGGYQLYFDEDATQPSCLLCALPGLKTEYLDTSDPNYPLKVTYNVAPGTPGVAISYDDGADNRLEFTSPTAANGTIDLASYALTWGWYDLPGSKGSLYRQSTYGDVKLLAGGRWDGLTSCGSRSRYLFNYRWSGSISVSSRFCSESI